MSDPHQRSNRAAHAAWGMIVGGLALAGATLLWMRWTW